MNEARLRILIIDNDPKDFTRIKNALAPQESRRLIIGQAGRLKDGFRYLENQGADVVLLDLHLPDSSGFATLTAVTRHSPLAAIIVLSEDVDEETTVLSLREGAQDYLSKNHLDPKPLWRVILNAIERKRLQEMVRKSQERFELITQGSTDGLWDWSLETKQVYFSPRWKEMFGYAEQEIGNDFKEWEKRIHPEDLEKALHTVSAYLKGESAQLRLEHRMQHKDGSYRWILVRGVALRYSDGRPYRMAGTHVDISDLKLKESALEQAMENLQQSETRFRQLAEHINEVFWITVPSGQEILYVSPAYEQIWGRSAESLYQRPLSWEESIHEDDRERVRQAFAEKVALGGYDETYRIVRPDESIRWIRDRGFPVLDNAGQVYRIVGIAEDITRSKLVQEELEWAHEDLTAEHERLKSTQHQLIQAEKVNSIGRLAAGIAHEIKNPLATISMGVQFLTDALASPDDNTKLVLSEMTEAIERADSIARGLLEYSAPLTLQVKPEDLNALVQKAALLARHELAKTHTRIDQDLDQNIPRLDLDANKIIQVLLNLIMNAIHAMGNGGALSVRTRYTTVGQLQERHTSSTEDLGEMGQAHVIVLEVEDTGPGIPPEHLTKIFDPFFTTKPTGTGTGLGLAVSKSIVELHGASIELTNRAEGGVRATIQFLM